MFTTVGNKVYTIVNDLVATTDLNYVYNYEKKIGDWGYPYATVTPTSSNVSLLTSTQQFVEIPYTIAIYARSAELATVEVTIRGIVDAVLTALQSDLYLTGTALKSTYEIERGYADDEQPTRVATIKANYSLIV